MIWNQVVEILKKMAPAKQYLGWIEPLRGEISTDGILTLKFPNQFTLNCVQEHHLPQIYQALRMVAPHLTLILQVDASLEETRAQEKIKNTQSQATQEIRTTAAQPLWKFNTNLTTENLAHAIQLSISTAGSGSAAFMAPTGYPDRGAPLFSLEKEVSLPQLKKAPVVRAVPTLSPPSQPETSPTLNTHFRSGSVAEEYRKIAPVVTQEQVPTAPTEAPKTIPLRWDSGLISGEDLYFDQILVGKFNRVAFNLCSKIAQTFNNKLNPIYLCGTSGNGKTQLLSALGHELLHKKGLKVKYLTVKNMLALMNQYYQTKRYQDFDSYFLQQVDVLLLDDLQELENKNHLQEKLLLILKFFHENQKQVVLCADRPAKNLNLENERLKSRLTGFILAEILEPDLEDRETLIDTIAQKEGYTLDPQIVKKVAENPASCFQIIGQTISILSQISLNGDHMNRENLMHFLNRCETKTKMEVDLKKIEITIMTCFDLKPGVLQSPLRNRSVAQARQMALYLGKKHTHKSLKEIGEHFNRDHATVLYAEATLLKQIDENPKTVKLVEFIESRLFS